jgi:hypothetical protein
LVVQRDRQLADALLLSHCANEGEEGGLEERETLAVHREGEKDEFPSVFSKCNNLANSML